MKALISLVPLRIPSPFGTSDFAINSFAVTRQVKLYGLRTWGNNLHTVMRSVTCLISTFHFAPLIAGLLCLCPVLISRVCSIRILCLFPKGFQRWPVPSIPSCELHFMRPTLFLFKRIDAQTNNTVSCSLLDKDCVLNKILNDNGAILKDLT